MIPLFCYYKNRTHEFGIPLSSSDLAAGHRTPRTTMKTLSCGHRGNGSISQHFAKWQANDLYIGSGSSLSLQNVLKFCSVSDTLCHIYNLFLELIHKETFLCQHVSRGSALCIAAHSLCLLQEYHAVAKGFQSIWTHRRWWSAPNRGSLFSADRSGEDNGVA